MPAWLVMWLMQHAGWLWGYAVPDIPNRAICESVHHVVNIAQRIVC